MDSLEKIRWIFSKYSSRHHFYLLDLRTGKEIEIGHKERYPIGSCFKLAVLMAYFDSIKDLSGLDEEVVISPEQFSPGGGVLNFLTSPIKLNHYQMANMMIAFSDGTATDILMDKVGAKVVDSYLKQHAAESAIRRNLKQMVSEYNAALLGKIKNGYPRDIANEEVFREQGFDHDYTNGEDLAKLALGTYQFSKAHRFSEKISTIFLGKRFFLRTSMYLPKNVKFFGKSGSIGFGYFMNDCGVIEIDGEAVGIYGYASAGWQHVKDFEEAILGFVGLSIAQYLDQGIQPNEMYSKSTEDIVFDRQG